MEELINPFDEILKNLMKIEPEVTDIVLLDINGNVIASITNWDNLQSISVSSAVAQLSIQKLTQMIRLDLDVQFLRCEQGYLIIYQISPELMILVNSNNNVKLGLIFLDLKRLRKQILDVPYEIPKRKESLEDKLQQVQDEIQENYKVFFSYCQVDSERFHVKKIAEFMMKRYPNVEVKYFEKSKTTGEAILDYMEESVKWCNIFVWFYSENAADSGPVQDEYKMAKYLSKKIISVTEDFNILPLSARVAWALKFEPDLKKMASTLYNDIQKLLS